MQRLPLHNLAAEGNDGDVVTRVGGKWTAGAAGGHVSGYREVLMTDGVSSPPEPLWNEDGTDWLYGEALT